jgi:hypothetical protein
MHFFVNKNALLGSRYLSRAIWSSRLEKSLIWAIKSGYQLIQKRPATR